MALKTMIVGWVVEGLSREPRLIVANSRLGGAAEQVWVAPQQADLGASVGPMPWGRAAADRGRCGVTASSRTFLEADWLHPACELGR